jgi:hypothetical protein
MSHNSNHSFEGMMERPLLKHATTVSIPITKHYY